LSGMRSIIAHQYSISEMGMVNHTLPINWCLSLVWHSEWDCNRYFIDKLRAFVFCRIRDNRLVVLSTA
jgi:hypothetical protein